MRSAIMAAVLSAACSGPADSWDATVIDGTPADAIGEWAPVDAADTPSDACPALDGLAQCSSGTGAYCSDGTTFRVCRCGRWDRACPTIDAGSDTGNESPTRDVADAAPDVAPCVDNDVDGWGVGPGCMPEPTGWERTCSHATPCAWDCNDADPLTHPHANEACDGIDSNCDGFADVMGDPSMAGLVATCRAAEPSTLMPACAGAGCVLCGVPGSGYALPQRCIGTWIGAEACWTDPEDTLTVSPHNGAQVPCH